MAAIPPVSWPFRKSTQTITKSRLLTVRRCWKKKRARTAKTKKSRAANAAAAAIGDHARRKPKCGRMSRSAPDAPFLPFDEVTHPSEPVGASHAEDEGREGDGIAASEEESPSEIQTSPEPLDEEEDEDEHEVTTLDGGAEERAPRARHSRGEEGGEAIEHVGADAGG